MKYACLLLVVGALGAAPPTPMDATLRAELLKRMKIDQEARHALIQWQAANPANGPKKLEASQLAAFEKLAKDVERIDRDNTQWLSGHVAKHGWPTITLVSQDGAQAAWLLVQHADANVKFQRQCLDLMTKLPKTEVSPQNVAYLTDRVLLAEGKKQRFGTQFHFADGKLQPRPIEDEAKVDQRRAELGLMPLAEYAKELEKLYRPATKKEPRHP